MFLSILATVSMCGAARLQAQGALPSPVEQDLVSANVDSVAAAGTSTEPAVSLDGGFVAFQSDAPDIDPADGDRLIDIFLRDMTASRTRLISTGPFVAGLPSPKGNGPSRFPSVSEGGRFVVFASDATNLDPSDDNGKVTDIFLHDTASGKNVLVSVGPRGRGGNGPSDRGVISASGAIVAFQSMATNLAGPAAAVGFYRNYLSDVATGKLMRIDPPMGAAADGDSLLPQLDADGSRVVFESTATNLVSGDANDVSDVFVFDRATGQISLVSVGDRRRQGDRPSGNPRISADGRFVAFESAATNLVGGDTNGAVDVFVRDLAAGRTERVSLNPSGEQVKLGGSVAGISADGRFVGFVTQSPLFATDGNEASDFYVRDRLLDRTFLVSVAIFVGDGQAANGASRNGSMSGDGQSLVFESAATNLSRFDQTPRPDVYRAFVPMALNGPFPPSNNLLLNLNGALRQLDLTGRPTGKVLSFDKVPIRGMAVDDANALWVQTSFSLFRFKALTLEPAQAESRIPVQFGGDAFHGLVAAGGFAWAAIDDAILRFGSDGEVLRLSLSLGQLPLPPENVSLALSPSGQLWAAVARKGENSFLKLTRDLKLLTTIRRPADVPIETIACDADGSIFARSPVELTKLASSGGLLWSRPLAKGGGLAVDGDGSVFTVTGAQVLGFHANGRIFLELDNPGIGQRGTPVQMAVDGLGNVYFTEEGAQTVFRFAPGQRPTVIVRRFTAGDVGGHGGGDLTGFIAANVSAQKKDADGDGFLNRQETAKHFNPFDAGSPSPAKRLPPVLDLTASALGKRQVRLEWRSVRQYVQFFIFRDGRPIAGSPFSFDAALRGVIDTNVPGGIHLYRVIGQGATGAGAGGGFDDGSGSIPEPYTLSQEASVSQGEGSVLATVSTPSPPDAVAFDSSASRILAALAGGKLWTLDTSLNFVDEATLPADPFGSTEVRGMAVDAADAQHPLYMLLGDGRMFRRVGAANPVAIASLSGYAVIPDGFTGLAATSGNGNDLFTTMAGPGVDCLIGFLRSSGVFKNGDDKSVSSVINTPVEYSAGVSRIGNALLAGVGINLDGGPPAINRVVKINLGANFALTDAGASVSLAALGSSDIPSFDYAPGVGLFVADRSASRIAIIEALFPGSLQVLSVTPSRSRRNVTTPDVEIAGTGFGANAGDLQVKFDGFDVPIKSLVGGVIKVDAPALGEARVVMVEVSSTVNSTTDYLYPGFTYGFQRGDANDDGNVAMSDAIFTLNFLFSGGATPPCQDAADTDDTEKIDISDAIYLLNFLFLGTKPPPPPPFAELGVDADGDVLGCGE